ncbi:uncharacterized protein LOC111022102 [Momordica charantia]|uniref:Uncharacterized protein LOC111022102 n=1 Tax=Momordica charantia TaxID=3673 RepID=A0A6J1DLP8_MOMCH|nr:uncharacterized protein LOC111022102 [Momordica charantia]
MRLGEEAPATFIEWNSISTPVVSSSVFSAKGGELFPAPSLYRSIVGSLQYVTVTRPQPEIAYVVNRVCQFMHQLSLLHWQAVKRILRYLKGALHHGLLLSKPSHLNIHGFADDDWASNLDDRKSTSSYCIYFGGNLVTWGSMKQHIISGSSTEAEFCCIANAATKLIWLHSRLKELSIVSNKPSVLWCDNLEAVHLSANPTLHLRTKHVELDIYFVGDLVLQKKLVVMHLPSTEQIADVFTKPLSAKTFLPICDKLNFFSPEVIGLGVLR